MLFIINDVKDVVVVVGGGGGVIMAVAGLSISICDIESYVRLLLLVCCIDFLIPL